MNLVMSTGIMLPIVVLTLESFISMLQTLTIVLNDVTIRVIGSSIIR